VNTDDKEWARYFDFNDPSAPFWFLGRQAGSSVQNAADWFQRDARSPKAIVAAVEAARLAIPALANAANAPAEVTEALAGICTALERAERSVLAEAGRAPRRRGPRAADERAFAFQARAVLAATWLQALRNDPMTEADALTTVATEIGSPHASGSCCEQSFQPCHEQNQDDLKDLAG
jgi:hypothetical protein